MEKNYYEILGITEDEKQLPEDEFKKVLTKKFRELSKKYHPDKHVNDSEEDRKAAEEMYKDISLAKDVLSDPNKRAEYDSPGFGSFGGGFNPFGGGFNPFGFGQPKKRKQRVDVYCTLIEAFTGCEKTVSLGQKECPHCHGTGVVTTQQQTPFGYSMYQEGCRHCHGTGFVNVDVKDAKQVVVEIPKGSPDGLGLNYGDFNLVIHVSPDNIFVRPNNDETLGYILELPYYKFLLGFKTRIIGIDGESIEINVPECTHDGAIIKVEGQGMSTLKAGPERGDLLIRCTYSYPDKLSDKERTNLLELFNDTGKTRTITDNSD